MSELLLRNLAIGGYRSFAAPQRLERFSKVNIFIGQNNSGKSNILRFIHEVLGRPVNEKLKVDELAYHLPDRPPMVYGQSEPFEIENGTPHVSNQHRLLRGRDNSALAHHIGRAMRALAQTQGASECWTLRTVQEDKLFNQEEWNGAVGSLGDRNLQTLWSALTNMGGGGRSDWQQGATGALAMPPLRVSAELIPAIRQIGQGGTEAVGFAGVGIIDRLAKLQNPDVSSQSTRRRFQAVTEFLREVVGRPDASIEVPYLRDTILVHMDGKVLPIESLGSGIHEVIILAAAATVLSGKIICMEEPELHLNPILQKKLLRYLSTNTDNQYFITTHSAALMDTPGAEVYHVRLQNGASVVERVTSDSHRSEVCADLGYHPSDLLQANCIVWVEGPSDRLYLNWWLQAIDSSLVEGIHYSIMFYGGKLAAHLSHADPADVNDFISLRRLNHRAVMLMDSDKSAVQSHLNETKKRLRDEFNRGPGHAWITSGREIENYIAADQLLAGIAAVHPGVTPLSRFGRFDQNLKVQTARRERQASKVDVARHVVQHSSPTLEQLDLRQQLQRLRAFIVASNPVVAPQRP